MKADELSQKALERVVLDSELVRKHLEFLKRMIAVDSRSFGVNEFEGDRKTVPDMVEILALAEEYLRAIGFSFVKINRSRSGEKLSNPILMAEILSGSGKPTLLFYAHLDKQPYMDGSPFERWGGSPPTEARWNEDKTRLYGRGAADDLAGVTAIGMTVDALLQTLGFDPQNPSPEVLAQLPCNIKVIYETEEESGSHTLKDQIVQNQDFFCESDCVLITDVINPRQGFPGLTISLRGIIQLRLELIREDKSPGIDAQTALFKLSASLIESDHSLAVKAIADADTPTTENEEKGYALVPTTVSELRNGAGLLSQTRLTVAEDKGELIKTQLRKSFANVRPGNRISGSIIFGAAGARLTFKPLDGFSSEQFQSVLKAFLQNQNPFQLRLEVREVPDRRDEEFSYDILLQSAIKDPHSGVHGGPFPIPELQLARMIDALIRDDGTLNFPGADDLKGVTGIRARVAALFVDSDLWACVFDDKEARVIVEIRLAPGNNQARARAHLCNHLKKNVLPGFKMKIEEDKGASPWITRITHPAYAAILQALETGYSEKPCLYGCGGSIPFVPKLMDALGAIPSLCLGAYDPDSKMHEPGESMSLVDWLGCARSMIHFIVFSETLFKK